MPALDVKVVPADADRFGEGHGFNTAPSAGTPAAIAKTTEKIRDKGRLLAGMALDAAPDTLEWRNGAWASGEELQDDRGRRALRARHRRAAAGRRGRPRRADRLPGLKHAGHELGGRRVVEPLAVEPLPGPEVERERDERARLRPVEAGGRASSASSASIDVVGARQPRVELRDRRALAVARAAASARSRGTSRRARSAPRAAAPPGPSSASAGSRSGRGCSAR